MKRKLGLLLATISIAGVLACGCSSSEIPQTSQDTAFEETTETVTEVMTEIITEAPTEEVTEAPKNDPSITLEEYNKIQIGMTYDEVVSIIGSAGTETTTSSVGEYTMSMISWEGNGLLGSNAYFTFQNGEVTAKSQFGLE